MSAARAQAWLALVCALGGVAAARAGSGIYPLDWENPAEVLEYHSCGCADSCWVAELRDVRTRELRARLRCDCERMYVALDAKTPDQLYADNCAAFEVDEVGAKPRAIIQWFERQRRADHPAPTP